ncbi:hypothetical protein BC567DRAFT_224575 [Phyllosticta citribraziliensis]
MSAKPATPRNLSSLESRISFLSSHPHASVPWPQTRAATHAARIPPRVKIRRRLSMLSSIHDPSPAFDAHSRTSFHLDPPASWKKKKQPPLRAPSSLTLGQNAINLDLDHCHHAPFSAHTATLQPSRSSSSSPPPPRLMCARTAPLGLPESQIPTIRVSRALFSAFPVTLLSSLWRPRRLVVMSLVPVKVCFSAATSALGTQTATQAAASPALRFFASWRPAVATCQTNFVGLLLPTPSPIGLSGVSQRAANGPADAARRHRQWKNTDVGESYVLGDGIPTAALVGPMDTKHLG